MVFILRSGILFNSPDLAYTENVYGFPMMNLHGADVQSLTPIDTSVAGFGPVAVYIKNGSI